MNLAVKETVNDIKLTKDFTFVSRHTNRAAMLFVSFSQLDKKQSARDDKHLNFRKWVFHQEVKYFNEFIESFTKDKGESIEEIVTRKEPTPAFIELRSLAMGGESEQ